MSKGKTLQVPRDRVGKLTFDGRILASLSTGLPGHAPIRAWPVATPEDDGEDDRSGSGRAQRRRLSPEDAAASPAEAGAATGTSPGWLSGLVSGAQRLAVFCLLNSIFLRFMRLVTTFHIVPDVGWCHAMRCSLFSVMAAA